MNRPRRRQFHAGDRVRVVMQGASVPFGSRGTVSEVYRVADQCAVYFDDHEVLRILPSAALELLPADADDGKPAS